MPSIKPLHWKTLECIFTKYGFKLARHKGTSHRVYEKPGCIRPVVIPTYKQIGLPIIRNLMRTAGMTREEYFYLLDECG